MFRSQLTPQGISFIPREGEPARYSIFQDINDYIKMSTESLLHPQAAVDLVMSSIALRILHLPQAPDHKEIYSSQCTVRKTNTDTGNEWYEKTRDFKNKFMYCINFNRMSRAAEEAIDNPKKTLISIASFWDVSEYELEQILNWYYETGQKLYGAKDRRPEWWGQRIDEVARYKALEFEFVKQVNKKLATPAFSYLVDFYESRESIVQDLMREAWRAVLDTSHKSELDTLRMGKTYINTVIHHVAQSYTKHHGKQAYNKQNDTYETIEFSLLSEPDMDESKHFFLAHEASEYHEIEVFHTLDKVLADNEMTLVRVLTGDLDIPEFENYASGMSSRRIAAFNFFKVDAENLRDKLGYLFHS
jgi:hypothetical protein